jgi:putative inorganic carbon (HCO3(-)) transporter
MYPTLTRSGKLADSHTTGLRFSYALLLALGVNFLWATGHDQQRCIELLILGPALAFALASGAVARAVHGLPTAQRRWCALFLAFGAAASISVVSPRHALVEWSMFVLLGLTTLVVAAEIAKGGAVALRRLLQLVGLVCVMYSLRVLLMYGAAMIVRSPLDFHMLAVGFSNARFLNHTQTALLPILLFLSHQKVRTRMPAKVFFVTAAFWWSLIFLSEARATMLALATGALMGWVFCRQSAKQWLLTMAATVLAGLVLYLILYFAIPSALGMAPIGAPGNILERTAANPMSNRQLLWFRACELIVRHPVLGVGPQHFAHFGSDLQTGAYPYDWVFQIASEWGIAAWLCLEAVLVIGIRALLRTAAKIDKADLPQQDVAVTLIVAVTAILVDGLFSGVLVAPQSQLTLALVFGVTIGWVRSSGAAPTSLVGPITRVISTLLGGFALAILIFAIGPDIGRKWDGTPLTAEENRLNPGLHWPRLWEAGYF